jgi:transposase
MSETVIITSEDEQMIVEMATNGHGVDTIAEELGWSKRTIIGVLRKAGMTAIGHTKNILDLFSAEKLEQFRVDYEEARLPTRALVDKYNMSGPSVVYHLVSELGLTPRQWKTSPGNHKEDMLRRAVQLYIDYPQMSLRQIVEETGVSQPTISAELRRQKVQLRRPSMSKPDIVIPGMKPKFPPKR